MMLILWNYGFKNVPAIIFLRRNNILLQKSITLAICTFAVLQVIFFFNLFLPKGDSLQRDMLAVRKTRQKGVIL